MASKARSPTSPASASSTRYITPKFKSGDFAGGISAGVNRMIGLINGEKLPEPEPPHWDSRAFNISMTSIRSGCFFAFVVSSVLRARSGA